MQISDDVCLAALRGWNGWPADAPPLYVQGESE